MEDNLNDKKYLNNNQEESEISLLRNSIENINQREESRLKFYNSEEEKKNISDSTSIVSDSSDGYFENLTDSESSQVESRKKKKKVSPINSKI